MSASETAYVCVLLFVFGLLSISVHKYKALAGLRVSGSPYAAAGFHNQALGKETRGTDELVRAFVSGTLLNSVSSTCA